MKNTRNIDDPNGWIGKKVRFNEKAFFPWRNQTGTITGYDPEDFPAYIVSFEEDGIQDVYISPEGHENWDLVEDEVEQEVPIQHTPVQWVDGVDVIDTEYLKKFGWGCECVIHKQRSVDLQLPTESARLIKQGQMCVRKLGVCTCGALMELRVMKFDERYWKLGIVCEKEVG